MRFARICPRRVRETSPRFAFKSEARTDYRVPQSQNVSQSRPSAPFTMTSTGAGGQSCRGEVQNGTVTTAPRAHRSGWETKTIGYVPWSARPKDHTSNGRLFRFHLEGRAPDRFQLLRVALAGEEPGQAALREMLAGASGNRSCTMGRPRRSAMRMTVASCSPTRRAVSTTIVCRSSFKTKDVPMHQTSPVGWRLALGMPGSGGPALSMLKSRTAVVWRDR